MGGAGAIFKPLASGAPGPGGCLSRYRPSAAAGSKYITPAGERRLRDELDALWRLERPRVTAAVAAAAAQGDRSENAEYVYGKRRLREIDRRVSFLRERLRGMRVVTEPPRARDRIYFAARVTLADPLGRRHVHRIVGPDEFDMAPGNISMDAPLAQALLGRSLADEVAFELRGEVQRYTVVAIEY
jgi:transcription elongation factor GreB